MSNKDWSVISDDQSKNAIETSDELSTLVMYSRVGMWGESMFGDYLMLGSGYTNVYLSNVEKTVLAVDLSNNVDRRLSTLISVTMMSRPGMWGEAMFGSGSVLGSGSLNYYEG